MRRLLPSNWPRGRTSSSTNNDQVYEQLPHSKSHIRLVSPLVLAGAEEPLLQLQHAKLHDTTYDALSYIWGHNTGSKHVRLVKRSFAARNPATLQVQDNLFDFLQILYAAREKIGVPLGRLLWIDAISINQTDVQERNSQVSLMGDIYQNAQKVYVWLGKNCMFVPGLFHILSSRGGTLLDLAPGEACASLDIDMQGALSWAILELYEHPYWSRVWITQELIFAKSLVFCCNDKVVPGDIFLQFLRHLHAGLNRYLLPVGRRSILETSRLETLLRQKNDLAENYGHDDLSVFSLSRGAECTDPRDRVYGLLSLMSQEVRTGFQVDYDEQVSALFCRVIEWFELWRTPFDLDLLLNAMGLDSGNVYADLKSLPQRSHHTCVKLENCTLRSKWRIKGDMGATFAAPYEKSDDLMVVWDPCFNGYENYIIFREPGPSSDLPWEVHTWLQWETDDLPLALRYAEGGIGGGYGTKGLAGQSVKQPILDPDAPEETLQRLECRPTTSKGNMSYTIYIAHWTWWRLFGLHYSTS